MIQGDVIIRTLPDDIGPLTAEGRQDVLKQIETMTQAAKSDWARYLKVSGDLDLNWISAIDQHYHRDRIRDVIKDSQPDDFSNNYLVTCCEFGAAMGYVLRSICPRLLWYPDWPYWESALLDPQSNTLIPVFHWAVKKMSEYGVDDGFAEKIQVCIQMLNDRAK